MKIRLRPPRPGSVYDAHRWRKNGDHPEDRCQTYTGTDGKPFQGEGSVVRYYRRPDVPGEQKCDLCGCTMDEHGWIDQSAPSKNGFQFANGPTNPFHPSFMPEDNRVCPGGVVVTSGASGYYSSISPKDFAEVFEVIEP
jgi:hypothetical protein